MAGETVQDPYQTLGVKKDSAQDDIRNAYRKLAKKFHPDLNPGNASAEKRFKEINAAYEKVGDVEARKKFEQGEADEAASRAAYGAGGPGGASGGGRQYYSQTQGGPGGGRYSQSFDGIDPSMFESLFGGRGGGTGGAQGFGRRRPAGPQKGDDELFMLDLQLRDIVTGGKKELQLPNGKKLEVNIPPGVDTGVRLRFGGQGALGQQGGPAGDVFVELRVQDSPDFRRDGLNVESILPITLSEGVLGGEVRVPTLDGSVMLKVSPGVQTGARLRLKGKGIPDRKGGARGDQIVVIQVQLPKVVDEELASLIRDWSAKHPYSVRDSHERTA